MTFIIFFNRIKLAGRGRGNVELIASDDERLKSAKQHMQIMNGELSKTLRFLHKTIRTLMPLQPPCVFWCLLFAVILTPLIVAELKGDLVLETETAQLGKQGE